MRVLLIVSLCLGCQDTRVEPPKKATEPHSNAPQEPAKPAKPSSLGERLKSGSASDADLRTAIAASAANQHITYAHLKKNADRYKGEVWRFRGRILEISEDSDGTTARIGLGGYGQSVMYVIGNFATDFVENDRVDVLGALAGTYSYTSQAGWNITIPAMLAFTMEQPGELDKLKATPRKRVDDE